MMDSSRFDNADPTARGQERGEALPAAGDYEFEIVDVRENVGGINTPGGYGFYVDLRVVSGPADVGFLTTKKFYPFAPPSVGANGKSVPAQVKTERDLAAMKRWLAAAFGIDPKDAAAVKTNVTMEVLKRSVTANGVESPLKGKRVKGTAKAYNGKRGPTTFLDDIFPSTATTDIATRETIPQAPPAPTAAAQAPRFPHPAMPGHTYDATGAIFDAAGAKVN